MNQSDELQLVERYYERAIADTRSDEEELAVALQLLEKAERGFVVNDAGTGLIYISEPDIPVDADFLIEEASQREKLVRALPIVGLLVAALVAILLLYGDWGGGEPEPAPTATGAAVVHLATQTLTPTPAPPVTSSPTPVATDTPLPTPTSIPTETPTPAPAKEIEVKPEPVELASDAVIPVSLEIAGRYFPVVPTTLRDDAWAYLPDPGQVSWLAGSYVNVVLGLPYTGENLDLLATALVVSDTGAISSTGTVSGTLVAGGSVLVLRDNVGGASHYRVSDRFYVGVFETEVLGQRRVGLTLVLLGGNEENPDRRLVIWAVPIENPE